MAADYQTASSSPRKSVPLWVYDVLLVLVILAGAYFRSVGLDWGEYQYLHPDERFLVWVGTDITPVKTIESGTGPGTRWITISEYFDTPNSPLNPNNRGHTFYVYGTLPIFMARFAVEWIFGHSGFDVMTQVGRPLSALSDLLTVLMVYLIAARLYDRRVGLLSAAFSAAAVMQIQQSHFFTTDNFSNLFAFLAFYFAVRIMTDRRVWPSRSDAENEAELELPDRPNQPRKFTAWIKAFFAHPLFWPSLAFGMFFGMALASKLSIYPIALILPAAIAIRLLAIPSAERSAHLTRILAYLVIAGVASLIVFRLAQPYAFSGPGFLGVKPNPLWLAQIREQRNQATREVDFPPAMQWARRPVWFSAQNLTIWGLGLPLGLLAWFGFLWVGWRMLKGEWQQHALIWGWTAGYFIWQSLALNPTMRYQLPIYPTLSIFAGWAVVRLWDTGKEKLKHQPEGKPKFTIQQALSIIIGILVVTLTFAYAYGFTRIYTRQITRIEASRWIYQNAPGPVNLRIENADGTLNQPLPFSYNGTIMAGAPYSANFSPHAAGELKEIFFPYINNLQDTAEQASLVVSLKKSDGTKLAEETLTEIFKKSENGENYSLKFDPAVPVDPSQSYSISIEQKSEPPEILFNNRSSLRFLTESGELKDYPAFSITDSQWRSVSSGAQFQTEVNGTLLEFFLPENISEWTNIDQPVELKLNLTKTGSDPYSVDQQLTGQPTSPGDERGPGYIFSFNEPIYLTAGEQANLSLSLLENRVALTFAGTGLANEGEWDDGIPLRMDGYDGFGGIYPLDLNFNMYWDDSPEKLERFLRILNDSDYILISSNRQWGSLPRIPERFPMTTLYYRSLLGCPPEQDIVRCYSVAEPGMFEGQLGFDLVKTFQSSPAIGPITLNDQFAEEAFTVYDHPKVLIFQKNERYKPEDAQSLLSSVDFDKILRLPPLKFTSHPADLLLPIDRWLEQQKGGTFSNLFNLDGLQNSNHWVSTILWYFSLSMLGLLTYPILRLALPGLSDRGYPLARTAGLLLLSYLTWLAGSLRIPFTRPTISLILLALALIGGVIAYKYRQEIRTEWHTHKHYYLIVEALFLVFFLLDLVIRVGNPDLWHPWKGGEKPMDFAYLNAVLKSTSFPPYDPWFAGGYLNYYYYGFVLVGVLIKWLGIAPSIAYNLILPTMFSLIALGAFSIAWNLFKGVKQNTGVLAYYAGLAGALGMALIGNLGTVKMIYQGYQRLAAPSGAIDGSNILQRLVWATQGFLQNIAGTPLPYAIGDWYWNPSRAIPSPGEVEPITEFPFFTVLYADLHAHLFSLPIALLALGFAVSIVLSRARWGSRLGGVLGFLIGGLAIGALRPTNTWDFYPYLTLGVIAVGYAIFRYYSPPEKPLRFLPFFTELPQITQKLVTAVLGILVLVGLSHVLYQPYANWYGLGYNKIDYWWGLRTPLSAYLTHWGLFLFVLVSWMSWETRQWMAETPLSSLQKLRPFRSVIFGSIAILLILTISLVIRVPQATPTLFGNGAVVVILVLPLAAWAGVLLIRPGQPDAKRFTLFLIGTGLVLTIMVEVVVLVGDIGRMNTVFKFYLQVWTLFAVSAAAALGWLLLGLKDWTPGWRNAWMIAFTILVAGAFLYPITASRAKILDRMTPDAPRSLDGMEYMQYSQYDWQGPMDLSQDYRAIRWMQENVQGSPVIVEGNLRDLYRWGSRFSIYTGLPGVVGWEWHQQQQRALTPGHWVSERIGEVDNFYTTTDLQEAREFLKKYGVKYIIVGQLENNHYPGPGLRKFATQNGVLWQDVYQDRATSIYEVIDD